MFFSSELKSSLLRIILMIGEQLNWIQVFVKLIKGWMEDDVNLEKNKYLTDRCLLKMMWRSSFLLSAAERQTLLKETMGERCIIWRFKENYYSLSNGKIQTKRFKQRFRVFSILSKIYHSDSSFLHNYDFLLIRVSRTTPDGKTIYYRWQWKV